MKILLGVCIIVLAFVSGSFAKLRFVPLEEAVKTSDLIVVGTLQGISEKTEIGATYGKGEILVEEFLAGNVKTIKGFALKAGHKLELNYVENFPCVMGSHRGIENEKGVFLLTLDVNGKIQSEDFRSLESLTEINNLLRRGIKPTKIFKTIKTQNETEQYSRISTIENPNSQTSEISFGMYTLERKINYRPISALLVILVSGVLYYLLYRSRFKIR